jgi:demethylmenaquinone methyltransferase/2-methoxy-6-polyprenyl-1,4-benzoquinol methylase
MENKKRFVKEKFASIAETYDFLNTLLSFGMDRRWRRKAIKNLCVQPSGHYLDFCAGTLPLSVAILKNVRDPIKVVAYDFCREMLVKGRQKYGNGNQPELIVGDGEIISFKDNSCDGAVVGFGIRNLANMDKGLSEVARILKSGSKLIVLDFSNKINPIVKPFYQFYLEKVMPLVGGIISGDRDAYRYLADSIESFPKPEGLKSQLLKAGFHHVYYVPLTFGIAYIHVGTKG